MSGNAVYDAKALKVPDEVDTLRRFDRMAANGASMYKEVLAMKPDKYTINLVSSSISFRLIPDAGLRDSVGNPVLMPALFDACRTCDYIPAIRCGEYVKMRRWLPDHVIASMRYAISSVPVDADTIVLYLYITLKNRLVVPTPWAHATESTQLSEIIITRSDASIEPPSIRALVKNVPAHSRTLYERIIQDVFYNKVIIAPPAENIHTDYETIAVQTDDRFNQYKFKTFIMANCALYWIIQVHDRNIKRVLNSNQLNFRYKLYGIPKAGDVVDVYVYGAPSLSIKCMSTSKDVVEPVYDFMFKLVKYFESKKTEPSVLTSVYKIDKRALAPAKVVKEMTSNEIAKLTGYKRRCIRAREPVVYTASEYVNDAELEQFRANPFQKHKGFESMYYKTTGGNEYIVCCEKKQYPQPMLVSLTGHYRTSEYPVVPCCFKSKQDDRLQLYAAYTQYLRGELDVSKLYQLYSGHKLERKAHHAKYDKTKMSICDREQYGSITEMKYIYTILMSIFNNAPVYRMGVVVPTEPKDALASFAHAVFYAVRQTFASAIDIDAIRAYARQHIAVCAQELQDSSLHDAAAQLDTQIGYKYIKALQAYFETTIFVVEYSYEFNYGVFKYASRLRQVQALEYDDARRRQCVLILENHGTEFSEFEYPVYEPLSLNKKTYIFKTNSEGDWYSRIIFDSILTKIFNIQFVPNPIPADFTVVAQEFDGYNRTRRFTMHYNNSQISVMCNGIPPLLVHDSLHQRGSAAARELVEWYRDYLQSINFGGFEIQGDLPPASHAGSVYDDFVLAHNIAASTKDNLLVQFATYNQVNEDKGAVTTMKAFLDTQLQYTRDIGVLEAAAVSPRISNVVPDINRKQYAYYIEFFRRTIVTDSYAHSSVKPNRYTYADDFGKNRYDLVYDTARILASSLYSTTHVYEHTQHEQRAPYYVALELPLLRFGVYLAFPTNARLRKADVNSLEAMRKATADAMRNVLGGHTPPSIVYMNSVAGVAASWDIKHPLGGSLKIPAEGARVPVWAVLMEARSQFADYLCTVIMSKRLEQKRSNN